MLWIALGVVLYLNLLITLGLITSRKGHRELFWLGLAFPPLWVIGVLMPVRRQDEHTLAAVKSRG